MRSTEILKTDLSTCSHLPRHTNVVRKRTHEGNVFRIGDFKYTDSC